MLGLGKGSVTPLRPKEKPQPPKDFLREAMSNADHTGRGGLGHGPWRENTEDTERGRERIWTPNDRFAALEVAAAAITHHRSEIERLTAERAEHVAALLAQIEKVGGTVTGDRS